MEQTQTDPVPEGNDLTAEILLPRIAACLATLNILLSVWPNEPDWTHAAIMAFVATGLWSTVILERLKSRVRNKSKKTDISSNGGEVSSEYLVRFYVVFASAYTVLTAIWAFVVGLWWIALAILPVWYWHLAYKNWRRSNYTIQSSDQ